MARYGEVQEWLNWTVSKTVVPQGTVGSNPTLSAKNNETPLRDFSSKPAKWNTFCQSCSSGYRNPLAEACFENKLSKHDVIPPSPPRLN